MGDDLKQNFVGRVYQDDAETLDKEAVTAIKAQLNEAAKYLMPNLYPSLEPEVMAAVKLIIWHYTVRRSASTFGQGLLGLSYVGLTPTKARLYAVLTVASEWLRQRLRTLLSWTPASPSLTDQLLRAADRLELITHVASLLNVLLFLRHGVYRSLTERLLRLKKHRSAPDMVSETNYTYLTREQLWRGLSELLMCILPLIDFRQLRAHLLRLLPARPGSAPSTAAGAPLPLYTARSRCVWCEEPPVLPHALQCCHLGCYYCLLATGDADSVRCADCGRDSDRREVRPVPVVRAQEAKSDGREA